MPVTGRNGRNLRLSAIFAAAVLLGGCAQGAVPTDSPRPASPAPQPTLIVPLPTATATRPTAAASQTMASIMVTGDDGVAVTLAAPPHKVISLTPATSELMFALGAGDRLVGRTDYDDYPAQVSGVPAVATFQGVEMEKVVNIGPDLVLAGGNNFTHADDIQRMRDLGYPVLVLYAKNIAGVLEDIKLVGQVVGEKPAADQINAAIQARIDGVSQALVGLPRPRTFYEIGNDPQLYGPAPNSFVADEITLAGGDPITTSDPSVFSIPLEQLVSVDPEVIVLGDAAFGVCPDSVVLRPGWNSMTAVKNGAIVPVDDTIVTRPGPRLGEGLAALSLAIHPDASIAPPADAPVYCAGASPSPSPS